MAKGKSLKLDGVVLKFYIFFYDIIGEGFFKMRIIAVKEGHLPNRVNKGLIMLLFKISERKCFGNSRLITFVLFHTRFL